MDPAFKSPFDFSLDLDAEENDDSQMLHCSGGLYSIYFFYMHTHSPETGDGLFDDGRQPEGTVYVRDLPPLDPDMFGINQTQLNLCLEAAIPFEIARSQHPGSLENPGTIGLGDLYRNFGHVFENPAFQLQVKRLASKQIEAARNKQAAAQDKGKLAWLKRAILRFGKN